MRPHQPDAPDLPVGTPPDHGWAMPSHLFPFSLPTSAFSSKASHCGSSLPLQRQGLARVKGCHCPCRRQEHNGWSKQLLCSVSLGRLLAARKEIPVAPGMPPHSPTCPRKWLTLSSLGCPPQPHLPRDVADPVQVSPARIQSAEELPELSPWGNRGLPPPHTWFVSPRLLEMWLPLAFLNEPERLCFGGICSFCNKNGSCAVPMKSLSEPSFKSHLL